MPAFLRPKPLVSWLSIEFGILFLLFCWALLYLVLLPDSPFFGTIAVQADSDTYYTLAGVADPRFVDPHAYDNGRLVAFNGNLLGPIYVAKIFRTPTNVALFNSVLLILMVAIAGGIPGVRRRVFLALFIVNAQSMVAVATLNKEIFAAFGMVAFMRYWFSPRRPWLFLALGLLFSLMARWEQVAILLVFMGLESRVSPFRRKHGAGLVALVAGITIAYGLFMRTRGGALAAFMISSKSAGLVSVLDRIQAHFGFFLVFIIKILMNLYDRWVTPWYFITPFYWSQDFTTLQTELIVPLQTLATLLLSAALFFKKRLRLSRTIPYLGALYLTSIAVSPFIQPRYAFPVYALMCLELSRSADAPEPPQKPQRWKFRLLSPDPREPLLRVSGGPELPA